MSLGCHIQWTANPELNIVGYKIYCGVASGIYNEGSSPKTVGLVTSAWYIVPSAGTWYLAVAAVNALGNESGLSQETAIVAETPPPPVGTLGLSIIQ